jgi:lauroyl/myristoyl acyltransferase
LAGSDAAKVYLEVATGWHLETVEVLRCHRPGGWNPAVTLHGEEHLRAATSGGRGAILWTGHFESASLLIKMGLARHGYRTFHLSRPDHGFSSSTLGIRFFNPIRLAAEDRYLAGRITMQLGETARSLRELRRQLDNGALVSILVQDRASQTREVRFFDSTIHIPTGPITLARASNVQLLPVFLLRRSHREFDLVVEEPLQVPATRSYREPMEQYARLLETYVRQAPIAYRGWQRQMDPESGPPAEASRLPAAVDSP